MGSSGAIQDQFNGAVVLITGGTGSFGKAIFKRLLTTSVKEIRIFSRDEQKHVALRRQYDDSRLQFLLGDVRDKDRITEVMKGVQIVFHAAALKHVDYTESHPYEAVRTNVEGARNVIYASQNAGVHTLLAISTDKAVHPVNVMGMTKALQERLITAASGENGLRAGCIRCGNVLASNGSVVPYFHALLRSGKRELPVTDRLMTRFMLTLNQGVDLLFYASHLINGGEIVVPNLPAFRMIDLAEVMLEAFGGGKVLLNGLRAGEKIHEALISDEEARRTEIRNGHFFVHPRESSVDKFEPMDGTYDSGTTKLMSRQEIRALLLSEGLLSS